MASYCCEASAGFTASVMFAVHVTDELWIIDFDLLLRAVGISGLFTGFFVSVLKIVADKITSSA